MNTKIIVVIITVAVIMGGAGFFSGVQYSNAKLKNSLQGQGGQFRQGAGGFNRGNGANGGFNNGANANRQRLGTNGFRPVSGEIISMDDKSITVKLTDGSSKIVFLNDTTVINKTDTAAKTDLKVNAKVGVFGIQNPDGSVTAQNIQLNPAFGGMMGGPGIVNGQNQQNQQGTPDNKNNIVPMPNQIPGQ